MGLVSFISFGVSGPLGGIATNCFKPVMRLSVQSEYTRLTGFIVENGYLNGEVIRIDGALRMQ
jgi:hypothetical protein